MELIGYYLLFACSLSLATCYFWFWPILCEAKASGITNSFTEYPKLSLSIYFVISAVIAPLLVFPMFNSAMALQFEVGLRTEMLKTDQEISS